MEIANGFHLMKALGPGIALFVAGLVVLISGARSSRVDGAGGGAWHRTGSLALVGILTAAAANGWLYGAGAPEIGRLIALDQLMLFTHRLFLASAFGMIFVSFGYEPRARLCGDEYYGLVMLATVGMMLMAGSRDLIVLFLGLEVMSVAVYSLAAINRRDRRSAEAGLKYFLLGAFSTGFFLYGIALVYGATGSVDLAAIASSIGSGSVREAFLLPGIILLLVGFAFKIAVVPFHMWTPDVYEGAPTPVTAWMSVAVKAAAFAAFVRVLLSAFPASSEIWQPVLWWLAAITMVAANLMALAQPNIKRMLAYSSIAHAGYLLVSLVSGNLVAISGMLFYLFIYLAMNLGAFAVVAVVARHGEEHLHLDDYAGLGKAHPAIAVTLTVFLLSLAGFPGTGGFMGKIFILQGTMEADLWTLAVVLVLSTLVSYGYYLRVVWAMWMRSAGTSVTHSDIRIRLPMGIALAVCLAVVIYNGIFPDGLLRMAQGGSAVLFEATEVLP